MRIIRKLIKFIIIFISSLIGLLLFQTFVLCPVYDFPEPEPFSGENIWNPYKGARWCDWKKANFQIQSDAWKGLTDGRKNSSEEIKYIYDKLEYDVLGISDYMKINTYASEEKSYIPTYEHGYNMFKVHQVCIGAKKVSWWDYPLFQTRHNKQFILNLLEDNDIVALAHPDFVPFSYTTEDMKYLCNYNLIEVLNHQKYSIVHWDSALSAGHNVYIIGNDDAHDISNPFLVGVECTMINTPEVNRKNIITSLKEGRAYGFKILTPKDETYELKTKRLSRNPLLNYVRYVNGKLSVQVRKSAQEIRFIGQNGIIKKKVLHNSDADYDFQEEDTYIRIEVGFKPGECFYLNPVIRYSGDKPVRKTAKLNIVKTILYRGGLFLIIVISIVAWVKRKRSRTLARQHSQ